MTTANVKRPEMYIVKEPQYNNPFISKCAYTHTNLNIKYSKINQTKIMSVWEHSRLYDMFKNFEFFFEIVA